MIYKCLEVKLEDDMEKDNGEGGGCVGFLTVRWSIQFLFERSEHLQGEGLALLPDINELLDLLLNGKHTSKLEVHTRGVR